MLFTQIIMCILLYYQVTMPAVQNGKYHPAELDGCIVMVNTQSGVIEEVLCKEVDTTPNKILALNKD